MRASSNEATGTSGQSYVKAQFEELGWGAVGNPDHDLGTDLWLMARDARRFDLGALVGAQVKTGSSWFEEPKVEDDTTVGWWFREADDSHFNYWMKHNVPHIVVLHNPADHKSFWVQVTEDKVISTGKGRKILVPADAIIGADRFEDLLRVAMSGKPLPEWEGSVWRLGTALDASEVLRYALLTPRLVAPHPNHTPESVTAAQAVAMIVQLRLHDLRRFENVQPLLEAEVARADGDWTWRLYAALYGWLDEGQLDPLIALVDPAPTPEARAAAAVCVSHALFEVGRINDALQILDRVVALDEARPVDQAWLQAHRARCVVETGQLQDARALALEVANIGQIASFDPTAKSLAGVAAEMIFHLGDWDAGSLADAIRGRDNLASWWRSQALVSGLRAQFEEDFRAWGNDDSVTFAAEDVAWNKLRSTMLLAGYASDTPSWRYAAALLARREIMRATEDTSVRWALEALRLAGSKKDVSLVAGRLLEFGPVAPLSQVVSTIDLSASTRGSLRGDITLVTRAADVLLPEAADRHARWALEVLRSNGAELESRIRPTFLVQEAVTALLAAVAIAASDDVIGEIRQHIVGLPAVDQLVSKRYAYLIRTLGQDSWTDDQVESLASRNEDDHFEFAHAIEWITASRDVRLRESLSERVAEGDLDALSGYGNVTDLPAHAVTGMLSHLVVKVLEQIAAARQHSYGRGRHDYLRALVLLNVWHPYHANWSPCTQALSEPNLMPGHIAGAINLVGNLAEQIPEDIRLLLKEPLRAVAGREAATAPVRLPGEQVDARGVAAVTLALLFPSEVTDAKIRTLIRGTAGQRAAAARILVAAKDPSSLSLLASLASDVEVSVRAAVAEGLANWVTNDIAMPESNELLDDLLREPGVRLGVYISRALGDRSNTASFTVLVEKLKNHPSAIVRRRVANAVTN